MLSVSDYLDSSSFPILNLWEEVLLLESAR